jgi:hypothetical protein
MEWPELYRSFTCQHQAAVFRRKGLMLTSMTVAPGRVQIM